MSEDLIKREDAIEALYKYSFVSKDVIEKEIKAIPSADRPQGEWIYAKEQLEIVPMWECSCCRMRMPKKFNYCPNCGADMRGDNDGKDIQSADE